ncbi:hypothetical protein R80B4_00868 [Fibrobacteres bacterium R8-0-B4]
MKNLSAIYDPRSPAAVEKYSSAVTLSDMEVFIFPELMYALVLANIMSDRLWAWKGDPWFSKCHAQGEMKRVQRLKQYIMDRFSFNLDLDTWGLTSKEREIARFSAFISEEILARSNALFGYEGDKYYFDIDIRRHFGLDKYTSNIIPYWKTETVEAMEAFKFKEGYAGGAGECVSFAALYASAAFAVADIPLDKIFLLATPLHSQNFLDIGEGILTNNRRIVTKNMWYNGTELSAKARRALENETVTIVAHNTGCIHTVFPNANIDRIRYKQIKDKLTKFLSTDITYEILANFLRHKSSLQRYFQISYNRHGKTLYIEAEKVYSYEHSSKLRVGDATQENLLEEIEDDEFYTDVCPYRFDLGTLRSFLGGNRISIDSADGIDKLKAQLADGPLSGSHLVNELIKFCRTKPVMPKVESKTWAEPGSIPPITLDGVTCAREAREALAGQRGGNETVDLAFMAFRDLSSSPWKPFLKAAVERNPVCAIGCKDLSMNDAYRYISSPAFVDVSIYDDEHRLAQPDEVWNYRHGDGLEKAVTLASVYVGKKIHNGDGGKNIAYDDMADDVSIDISGKDVMLTCGKEEFRFETGKRLAPPVRGDW